MPIFSDAAAFRIIDSVAIALAQAYQLARARVAACASPVLRLMAHLDHVSWEMELLRRELVGRTVSPAYSAAILSCKVEDLARAGLDVFRSVL